MKWTNIHDLPKPLCAAIENQRALYSKGDADFSVTELIDAPLISVLKKAHADDLVEDFADHLWSLFGSLAHAVISNAGTGIVGTHVERVVMATFHDVKVKGAVDHVFVGDRLDDYKLTSSWSLIDGVVKPEWEKQENLYVHLLRNSENPDDRDIAKCIKKLHIVGMCRDWGPRMKAKMPTQIKMLPVRLWSVDECDKYLYERIEAHVMARESFANGATPLVCSDDERWAAAEVFAVMKRGRKSSLANCTTMEQAEAAKKDKGGDSIEVRPRAYKRCSDYCVLSKCGLCPYYTRTAGAEGDSDE